MGLRERLQDLQKEHILLISTVEFISTTPAFLHFSSDTSAYFFFMLTKKIHFEDYFILKEHI